MVAHCRFARPLRFHVLEEVSVPPAHWVECPQKWRDTVTKFFQRVSLARAIWRRGTSLQQSTTPFRGTPIPDPRADRDEQDQRALGELRSPIRAVARSLRLRARGCGYVLHFERNTFRRGQEVLDEVSSVGNSEDKTLATFLERSAGRGCAVRSRSVEVTCGGPRSGKTHLAQNWLSDGHWVVLRVSTVRMRLSDLVAAPKFASSAR